MPKEIELALAVYLNSQFYEMRFMAHKPITELDKIHNNLIEWIQRQGIKP